MSIVVHTIEDEEANPLYLRYMQLRSELSMLAARMSRGGYGTAAVAVLRGLDSMPIDLPGLPKLRRKLEDGEGDSP